MTMLPSNKLSREMLNIGHGLHHRGFLSRVFLFSSRRRMLCKESVGSVEIRAMLKISLRLLFR